MLSPVSKDLTFSTATAPSITPWMYQAPAIISFQTENGKFIEKNDKFISFGRYEGVSPYWGNNNT